MPEKRAEPEKVECNMTPMIDVTFLLIIFFMLITQMSSEENEKMILPEWCNQVLEELEPTNKVTINIPAVGHRARFYKLNMDKLPLDAMKDRLKDVAERDEKTEVIIRADKELNYSEVQAALIACAKAGLTKMDIAAFKEQH